MVMTHDLDEVHHSVTNTFFGLSSLLISGFVLGVARIFKPMDYNLDWDMWKAIIILGVTAALC